MMMRALLACLSAGVLLSGCAAQPGGDKPAFRVDPAWPKPFAEDGGVQLVASTRCAAATARRSSSG